ncbi:sigma 54-interacting transcriptional regulator [Neobacillus cucumis]|uniref:sigma-54-dependent Fis family transcriptional regulator n=1 Tax=Neobacillus cucumis TaxID=1740721 RepID=UPI0018DFF30D|nr:sigma-54-dependent Fis family transcriptional regulator [Neobacillus cucumis]MBI0577882.1 sigma 54-interacting transcriptional regulator [Neobacillus cucumis]
MLIDYEVKRKRLKEIKTNQLVWEWMTPNPVTVFPHQTIKEAVLILEAKGIDGLPVVDEESRVIGSVTKSRILSCLMEGLTPDYTISQVMTRAVVTIHKDDSIKKANELPVGRLPVVDHNGRIVGILTRTDILHSYAAHLDKLQETLHITETLRTILESAYEGIVVVDQHGIIREFNEAYSRFLGKKREDVIGKPVTGIIENTRLQVVLQTGIEERGYIQRIQGQDMVVHRIPIWKDEKVVGAIGLLIFQGVTELYNILGRMQELSRQITDPPVIDHSQGKIHCAFDQIIGQSPKIQAVKKIARKAANTPSTVLITGESGTGKELFANAIHRSSPYAEGPFISVNCAAIPEHLLEAELFGFEDGAFTGAKKGGKPGKFELAHKGTLFLDEIGDMPALMQSKILRVLQDREVERVGGIVKHPVDVRIVAATNRCLEQMIQDGSFREDLYYRLNIIRLEIPPLRERREDIPELLMHHLHHFSERFGLGQKLFSKEVTAALMEYSWPGNIRELVNTVEMLVSFSESHYIDVQELAPKFFEKKESSPTVPNLPKAAEQYVVPSIPTSTGQNLLTNVKEKALEREKALLIQTLIETNGNKAKAARILGIQRSTLYEKLKKHELFDKSYN